MDEENYVSESLFQTAFTAQMALLNQMMTMLQAIMKVLPREALMEALDAAAMDEHGSRAREAIAKLRGEKSIQDSLRDIEGLIQ